MARHAGRVSIDLGTGDGRLPHALAQDAPERLFIGLDASVAGLRRVSGPAVRAGLANLVYLRAAVEALPPELHGVADRVTVILPWGSLLAAVARPSVAVLQGVRSLCGAGALLTVVVSVDAARDFAEAGRLGLPLLDSAHLAGPLTAGYAAAGFTVCSVQPLDADQLARWPSTWARRLAHGRARPVLQIDARAVPR